MGFFRNDLLSTHCNIDYQSLAPYDRQRSGQTESKNELGFETYGSFFFLVIGRHAKLLHTFFSFVYKIEAIVSIEFEIVNLRITMDERLAIFIGGFYIIECGLGAKCEVYRDFPMMSASDF